MRTEPKGERWSYLINLAAEYLVNLTIKKTVFTDQ